jgi:hypothetical protein
MASGGSSIPARGKLGSAGKVWGSAQGLTYDRFRRLDGSEGVPVRGLGGTSLWWPLRARLRRGRANTRHWRLQGILVKAARVPHGCGKEQEGELFVEAPLAEDDIGLRVGHWAAFIAGRLPVFATKGCSRHNYSARRWTVTP